MKNVIYHNLGLGTYNNACFFLEQRLPITKVIFSVKAELHLFYVGDNLVAAYDEMTGELVVYQNLKCTDRTYGLLR